MSLIPDSVRRMAANAILIKLGVRPAEHRKYALVPDPGGSKTMAWQTVRVIQGRLRQPSGSREQMQGNQARAVTEWEFVTDCYDLSGTPQAQWIAAKDRLRIGGVEYDVVDDDNGRPGAFVLTIQMVRTK